MTRPLGKTTRRGCCGLNGRSGRIGICSQEDGMTGLADGDCAGAGDFCGDEGADCALALRSNPSVRKNEAMTRFISAPLSLCRQAAVETLPFPTCPPCDFPR